MSHPQSEKKSKKPENTAFKQQRLKSWQPLLTPRTVLITFFTTGLIFIPIGIGLSIASSRVVQIQLDYTKCDTAPPTFVVPEDSKTGITRWRYTPATKTCSIQFTIPSDLNPPVYMYYRLTNFYQNNRKYVKSFDSDQLLGRTAQYTNTPGVKVGKFDSNCAPLSYNTKDEIVIVNGTNVTVPAGSAQYYPCGLIANSMFSDNITNPTCVESSGSVPDGIICSNTSDTAYTYAFEPNGIAWPTDGAKYAKADMPASSIPTKLLPPPYWREAFPQWANGYNEGNLPNLATMERLQVWMRTAALPTFRKLWGKNTKFTLFPGVWQINVTSTFDTSRYGGTKAIVISTVSLLGGKNSFLGTAYIVVGTICLALGIAFLLRHAIKPRKLGDHRYLSWNQASTNRTQEQAGLMSGDR